MRNRLMLFVQLTRLNRPIGWLLVLWPTLWALWLASDGTPRIDLLIIFSLGAIVMRSAGCIINDIADRKLDGHVKRTQDRPLALGQLQLSEAWAGFAALVFIAIILVLLTNTLTMLLAVGALVLASVYPFMKRYTHLPQLILGAAFAWSIPMAFASVQETVPVEAWLVYFTVVIWTMVYDTFYAMVDRDDDIQIGIKSTAVLFGEQDRLITATLQILVVGGLLMMAPRFELNALYYLGVATASALFIYQQRLIRYRQRSQCFKAFLNNHWAQLAILLGIIAGQLPL
ncbi:4-hydroxybenzoate octaprenyltransferase [Gilvimarinus agarilyticus]|uniref:4-hydroxybenzoate octaprenyltransferase n=1 Tax=unclassified Gilvimarinus TaxID=2642066 RepID=UPI001C09F0E0|nr:MULTISPECIES: 4-hydroxybenzoate octaprenyltransferase [unclassified Gilvimarinus]MBU2884528.1 4-hydroxybenzoate octaprenyltransferase [Gilvimarinus agarilyticus]MDO6569656.1 4-hydroxybenzoate octaprenyltransferase [Gilvimarinus sp. 2_MG-2023]MDO6748017.1 4-hydroxybenzoate octaprenyltransferase [Gilvimarinus sp. 1_MG-2023]